MLVKRWKKNRDMDPVVTSGANYTHMHVVVRFASTTSKILTDYSALETNSAYPIFCIE